MSLAPCWEVSAFSSLLSSHTRVSPHEGDVLPLHWIPCWAFIPPHAWLLVHAFPKTLSLEHQWESASHLASVAVGHVVFHVFAVSPLCTVKPGKVSRLWRAAGVIFFLISKKVCKEFGFNKVALQKGIINALQWNMIWPFKFYTFTGLKLKRNK